MRTARQADAYQTDPSLHIQHVQLHLHAPIRLHQPSGSQLALTLCVAAECAYLKDVCVLGWIVAELP
jgi:hypothetical protein